MAVLRLFRFGQFRIPFLWLLLGSLLVGLSGLFSPCLAGDPFRILVQWEHSYSSPDMAGYRLYSSGEPFCESNDIGVREMLCYISQEGGVASFALTAFDVYGNESPLSAPFFLELPLNRAPIAQDATIQVSEDGVFQGSLSAGDPDGDILTFALFDEPTLGIILLEDQLAGLFSYLPDPDANGADSFTFQVSDPEGLISIATVAVNILPENDNPVAVVDFLLTKMEVAVEVDLLANDTDIDGDALQVGNIGTPIHGTVSLVGSVLRYEPKPGYVGSDYLTYEVVDGKGGSAISYFVVYVQPTNYAPWAFSLSLETKTGAEVTGTLKAFDYDGDPLTFSFVGNGFLGTVTMIDPAAGTFRYVPESGVTGVDMFTFQASDGKDVSLLATVTVAINSHRILPQGMVFETGDVQVDDQWLQVSLQKEYVEPVVVAFPVTIADEEPGVVQVRNIDGAGFEVRFREWEYLDGVHGLETVHYLVMEKGNYTLNDGSKVEVGVLESNGGQWFSKYDFGESFPASPVVVTTVQTVNQEEAAVGRLRAIDGNGFKYKLQNEEGASWEHTPETVGYIAWQVSGGSYDDLTFEAVRTTDTNTHRWRNNTFESSFLVAPHVVADQQSTDGGNTAGLRCRNLKETGLELQIDEEQSFDDEVYHITETAGYLALSIPIVVK